MRVKIRNKWYNVYDSWDAITIKTACEIEKIPVPEKLQQQYDVFAESTDHLPKEKKEHLEKVNRIRLKKVVDTITEEDIKGPFLEYHTKIILLLSDIPEDILDYTTPSTRGNLYHEYLERIVLGILYKSFNDYNPKGIRKFKHKGRKYYLPDRLRIHEEDIILGKEPTIAYTESCDIHKAWAEYEKQGIQYASSMIAIYCRRKKFFKKEKYNEQKVIERSEIFKELPMSVCLEVFFCNYKLSNKYQGILNFYSQKATETQKPEAQK